MKSTFKQRFWQIGKWFIGVFIFLFIFRLIYGFTASNVPYGTEYSNDFFSSMSNLRKNYASEKKFYHKEYIDTKTNLPSASSQKYEKTATVKSKTADFEKDVDSTKRITKNLGGIIQYEQKTGNKGNREIHLMIGINPEQFELFYEKLLKIGSVRSTEITKIDKTNEYRQLNATRESLNKTLLSLNELKSRAGIISDHIALQDKIVEIESKMQELGVELGNFDTENEFCTIRFSLHEGAPEKKITFMYRVKVALQWTIKYFAMMVFSFGMVLISIFILVVIVDKLKIIALINNKLND